MTQRLDMAALRLQTEFLGQLTKSQVQSVSAWPAIAFAELKSHETQISLDNREVVYQLKFKPKKTLREPQKLKILEESVWALLGDTWKTTFKSGSKILYAGTRRKEIRNEPTVDLGKDYRGFDPTRVPVIPQVRRGK